MSWNQDPEHPGQPPRPPGAPPPDWDAIMKGEWGPFAPSPAQSPNQQNSPNNNQQDDHAPQPSNNHSPDNTHIPTTSDASSTASHTNTASVSASQLAQLKHYGSGHDIRSALAFGILLLIACIVLLAIILITLHRRMRATGTYFKSRPGLADDEKRLAPYSEDNDDDGPPRNSPDAARFLNADEAETETITVAFPGRNSLPLQPPSDRPLLPVPEGIDGFDDMYQEQIAGHKELAQGIVTPSQSRPPTPPTAGITWLPWYRASFRSLRSALNRGGSNATAGNSSGSPNSSRNSSFRRPLRSMLRRSGTY